MVTINVSAQNIFRTACNGNLSRLDSLLQQSKINTVDHRGRNLLHWAVACKQAEVFDYLVVKGIEVNDKDWQNNTPMHVAVRYGNQVYFDKLIDLQTNAEWKSLYGPTLLELAVLRKDLSFVEKLVEVGIPINGANNRGSTALEISSRTGVNEIEEFLVANGADPGLVRSFEMTGTYLDKDEPGTTPIMFSPNFISTEEQEFGSVFNTNGTEFYFGVDNFGKNEIRISKKAGKSWTKPDIALVHDRYGYNDPFLSNDEQRLYFISNRALDGQGDPKDIDIWYVKRTENGWSEPINAGNRINTGGNEYYISFTDNGTMYFSSNGHGTTDNDEDYDIYYSTFIDEEFQSPVALGEAVNTESYEADVFVSPDESYIIFCSTRDDGFGEGDLYISFKNDDGSWTTAVNMGNKINSQFYEYCPFVTKDGKYLFYTSNQDIYWVSTEILNEIKSSK